MVRAAHLGAIALTIAMPLALCAVSRLGNVTAIVINWLFVALIVGTEIMKLILLHRDGELEFARLSRRRYNDELCVRYQFRRPAAKTFTHFALRLHGVGAVLDRATCPNRDHVPPHHLLAVFSTSIIYGEMIEASP